MVRFTTILLQNICNQTFVFKHLKGTVKSAQKISNLYGGLPFTISANDYFGQAIGEVGDLNGDGTTDLVVGAYGDDDGGTNPN